MSETGAGKLANCQWCGSLHGSLCPLVKAIEYHRDGAIKRVEFKTASDWPQVTTYEQPEWQHPAVSAAISLIF